MTDTDRVLGFLIPARNARGRIVRLGDVAEEILAAHAYAETPARLLSETLALAALMGAVLRPDEGQVTVQAQPSGTREGPVRLLVADYLAGALRGYVAVDPDKRLLPEDDLAHIFGEGRLVITLDQTLSAERYQGIVALEGPSLASAAQGYFTSSEQIPTLVRLAAERRPDGRMVAGGFIVQHLARSEEGRERLHVGDTHPDWAHVEALAATLTPEELLDPALALEALLWRLFHEDEVRVLPAVSLSRGCRCSEDYIRSVLLRFPEAERAQMRGPDGAVSVDCEFCARTFVFAI
ncbi:MAG: Hsp33 family molecular chaperone HslO [Sphingomonadaceae bacterium]